MDTVRLGLGIRALRRRRGLRQVDLAVVAGVSQATISRVERGLATDLPLHRLELVAHAVGARVDVRLLWQGEALDRLLDGEHAAIVEEVVARLDRLGWECRVEVTFAMAGERGAIDVLARHRASGIVLVVEVKSVVPDLQATTATLDRKARLAPAIARRLGWSPPPAVGRLLVLAEARTSRRRVHDHAATFGATYPDRASTVHRWIADPKGELRGLLFLPSSRGVHVRQRHRIRRG